MNPFTRSWNSSLSIIFVFEIEIFSKTRLLHFTLHHEETFTSVTNDSTEIDINIEFVFDLIILMNCMAQLFSLNPINLISNSRLILNSFLTFSLANLIRSNISFDDAFPLLIKKFA